MREIGADMKDEYGGDRPRRTALTIVEPEEIRMSRTFTSANAIDHACDPRALHTVGRDAEVLALSRAVRWHCERRVLLNGHSTVVFP